MLSKSTILSVVYDGPIDNVSYAYRPVILQRLPSLENGDAITQTITINPAGQFQSDARPDLVCWAHIDGSGLGLFF